MGKRLAFYNLGIQNHPIDRLGKRLTLLPMEQKLLSLLKLASQLYGTSKLKQGAMTLLRKKHWISLMRKEKLFLFGLLIINRAC